MAGKPVRKLCCLMRAGFQAMTVKTMGQLSSGTISRWNHRIGVWLREGVIVLEIGIWVVKSTPQVYFVLLCGLESLPTRKKM
jgi:hypothetical protein